MSHSPLPTVHALQAARLPDWPERLNAMLCQSLAGVFEWGEQDCCMFAANAIVAQTGEDPARELRGTYATAAQAAKVLGALGGVAGIAGAVLGQPLANPAFAKRGDIVCVPLHGRDTLGVVLGDGQWCAPGQECLVFRPMAEVAQVWGV